MPETTVVARPAPARAPAGGNESKGMSTMQRLLIGILFYVGAQWALRQYFAGSKQVDAPKTDAAGKIIPGSGAIPEFALRPKQLDDGATWNAIPQRIAPIWGDDSVVDIVIAYSQTPTAMPLKHIQGDKLVFSESKFQIGNYSEKRVVDTVIKVPSQVQENGTLWGHFYVGLHGSALDPTQPDFDAATAYHFAYPITQHIPRKKVAKVRSLLETRNLTAAELAEEEEVGQVIVGNYYHPNVSLSFIAPFGVQTYAAIQPAAKQFVVLESNNARDGSGQNTWYYPVLYPNGFWQLNKDFQPVNETVKTLPVHIELNNLSPWKFQLMSSIELGARETRRQSAFGAKAPGGGDGTEIEMIKEILLDTNPILLGITVVVSIAHIILETLAFGSDIAHYRKKKDNVGISVRSILANVFMQTIIFLYLLDNSQNTSWMILGSQVVGILIEFWKITTVVNVRIRDAAPGSLFPKRITFEDKHVLTQTEKDTKEYDEIAFKYLYWVAVPLLAAYAVYSVIYDEHKSWYSYIITTLVGSVYAYGFLMMVPSLYINYRLKSVAHLPGKAMMYKFLNTFIDDLFAFTIKMPFLHRLATLRDDVIFFVYIYQRWKYKVDYTRINEFGQGGDDDEDGAVVAKQELAGKVKELEGKGVDGQAGKEEVEADVEVEDEIVSPSVAARTTGAEKGAAKRRK